MVRSTILAAVLCAVVCACTADRTEIVVAVYSNLAVPAELDALRIDVVGPESTTPQTSMALLGAGQPSLPRTLGLVHEDGPLGPFTIRVAGRRGGLDVVERRARVSFIEGRTLLLRVDLDRRCLGTACDPNRTCIEGSCDTIDVSAESLPEWTGSLPGPGPGTDAGVRPDSGPPDAGGCTPVDETCNGADDDCDGAVDEEFDFQTDTDHCGGCGNACEGATRDCCDGSCGRC